MLKSPANQIRGGRAQPARWKYREGNMLRGSIVALMALAGTLGVAHAFDETKYPDLKGQWNRTAAPRWEDASKAPLTP